MNQTSKNTLAAPPKAPQKRPLADWSTQELLDEVRKLNHDLIRTMYQREPGHSSTSLRRNKGKQSRPS